MFHPPPRITRRTVVGAMATVIGVGAVAGCTGEEEPETAPAGPPDQVTYLTGAGLNALGSFVLTAEAKGYFDEVNIDVDIQPGSPVQNHELLASGQADFAHVDGAGAIIRYASGEDSFKVIGAVQQNTINALVALESSGITHPRDLEGATIGVGRGTVPETVFPAYAELAGIDADSVEFQYADIPSLVSLVVTEQADAVGLFVPVVPAVEAASGETAVVLPYSEYITDLYGTVIITRAELAEEDPDLVRRFIGALMRGLEYTVQNPEESAEILTEAEPANNPDAAAAQLRLMEPYVIPVNENDPVGVMDQTRMAQGIALLQGLGLVPVSSTLVSDQELMAWDLVPGFEEDQ